MPINLLAPDVQADPHPSYAQLRSQPGIVQVEPGGMWALSRYEDVLAALREPQRFSSAGLARVTQPPWLERNPLAQSMVTMDGPRHARMRALLGRAFSAAGLQRLERTVQRISEEVADVAARRREVDFLEDFALPLPRAVIGGLLGLDPALYPKLRRWSLAMAEVTAATSPEQRAEVRAAFAEMEDCLRAVLAERRVQPGDDMVSDLLRAEVDGSRLTDEELLAFLFLLVPAGMETTSNLLANAGVVLSTRPEEIARARSEPGYLPALVEELLRFEGPVVALFRLVLEPVKLSGTVIPEGEMVMLLLASANRDGRAFPEPDRFFPGRARRAPTLGFGQGAHACLGAALGRMEARLGLEALFARVREIRLRQPEVAWAHSLSLRGPLALPVELVPV